MSGTDCPKCGRSAEKVHAEECPFNPKNRKASQSNSFHGTVQMINTAPQIKHKWLLLYVPSDYGWEVGYWEGHRGGWRNRYGHAINPTHWTERPPDPTNPKV